MRASNACAHLRVAGWHGKKQTARLSQGREDYEVYVLSDAPTGHEPPAQGCRFGYPGVKKAILPSTATRLCLLCAFLSEKTTQPRCG